MDRDQLEERLATALVFPGTWYWRDDVLLDGMGEVRRLGLWVSCGGTTLPTPPDAHLGVANHYAFAYWVRDDVLYVNAGLAHTAPPRLLPEDLYYIVRRGGGYSLLYTRLGACFAYHTSGIEAGLARVPVFTPELKQMCWAQVGWTDHGLWLEPYGWAKSSFSKPCIYQESPFVPLTGLEEMYWRLKFEDEGWPLK